MSNKVLIFGIDSFTGQYLNEKLRLNDFDVVGTTLNSSYSNYCDITSFADCINILKNAFNL